MPSSSLPPLSSSSSLRLGTFNVGCGFQRKLPHILSRCIDLSLDIIALQEIGDPALQCNKLSQYSLIYSGGPSQHQAGVGLLISHDLAPLCRTYKRSSSGRLVGAVLEVAKGHQVLIISAYMPTGLDHRSAADSAIQTAHDLYTEIMQWTLNMQQVIVMGDLNETLTPHDRYPSPAFAHPRAAASARPSPIHTLQQEGFIDVFRMHHPDASREPGFTHIVHSTVRETRSRIDYIWTRGCTPSSTSHVQIDSKLHRQKLSAHLLLFMTLSLHTSLPPPCATPHFHVQLPNMRAITEKHRKAFAKKLDQSIIRHEQDSDLLALASRGDASSLASLAAQLTSITHDAAFATLPLTGAAPFRSKSILQLEAKRRDLNRLLQISTASHHAGIRLTHCPQWSRLYRHCLQRHDVQWMVDAHYGGDDARWLAETRHLIRATRIRSVRRSIASAKRRRVLLKLVHPLPSIECCRAMPFHLSCTPSLIVMANLLRAQQSLRMSW